MPGYLDKIDRLKKEGKLKATPKVAPIGDPRGYERNEINEITPRTYGDGQPSLLDRPPRTEQELRQLMIHLAKPENFAAWMERNMARFDPAEPSGPSSQHAVARGHGPKPMPQLRRAATRCLRRRSRQSLVQKQRLQKDFIKSKGPMGFD